LSLKKITMLIGFACPRLYRRRKKTAKKGACKFIIGINQMMRFACPRNGLFSKSTGVADFFKVKPR